MGSKIQLAPISIGISIDSATNTTAFADVQKKLFLQFFDAYEAMFVLL